jgi:hypothetical protein
MGSVWIDNNGERSSIEMNEKSLPTDIENELQSHLIMQQAMEQFAEQQQVDLVIGGEIIGVYANAADTAPIGRQRYVCLSIYCH